MKLQLSTLALAFIAVSLTACGGGGGSSSNSQNDKKTGSMSTIGKADVIASGNTIGWFFEDDSDLVYYGHNCQRFGDDYYEVYKDGFAFSFIVTSRGVELPSFCLIDTVFRAVYAVSGSVNGLFTTRYNAGLWNRNSYFDHDANVLYVIDYVSKPQNYRLTEVINAGYSAILTDESGGTKQVSILHAFKLVEPETSNITLYQPEALYQGDADSVYDIGHSSTPTYVNKPYEITGVSHHYSTSGCQYAEQSDYVIYNDGRVETSYDDFAFGVNDIINDSCVLDEVYEVLPHTNMENVNASMINDKTFVDADGVFYDIEDFSSVHSGEYRLLELIDGGHVGIMGILNSDHTEKVQVKSIYRKM